MALQVWLPLNGNLNNQGLSNVTFTNVSTANTTVNNNGKIGECYANSSYTDGGLISNATINLGSSQSMFCWFKFTSLTSGSSLGGAMVGQHRYSKNQGMGLTLKYVSSTTGYLSINTGNGSSRTYNTYCNTTLLQANTWYHGGYTYDGSQVKIYLNGVCENTVAISNMLTPSDYLIVYSWSLNGDSGNYIHSNYKLNGSLNDVRVYDHCLSPKEVKEISKGLVLHYPLDGGLYSENLFRGSTLNSTDRGTFPNNSSTNWNEYVRYYNGSSSLHTFALNSDGIYEDTVSLNGSGNLGISFARKATDISLDSSSYYTISCEAKTTKANATLDIGLSYYQTSNSWNWRGGSNPQAFTATNTWQKFTLTFKPDADTQYIDYCFTVVGNGSSDTFTIRKCKLEKGSVATEWCPSPYDTIPNEMKYATAYNGVVSDSSGLGNNGTTVGTLATSTDSPRYNNSTVFVSGQNYHIISPSIPKDGMQNSYTVSWWSKSSDMNGRMAWGSSKGNRLNLYPSNGYFCWNTGDGSSNAIKNGSTNIAFAPYQGAWHHYAMVGDGTNGNLYIDGAYVGKATTYKPFNSPIIYLSGWGSSTEYTWGGNISDFRIYATALSADDIKELYDTSAYICNNGTVCGYEFIEGSSQDIKKSGIVESATFEEGVDVAAIYSNNIKANQIMEI